MQCAESFSPKHEPEDLQIDRPEPGEAREYGRGTMKMCCGFFIAIPQPE